MARMAEVRVVAHDRVADERGRAGANVGSGGARACARRGRWRAHSAAASCGHDASQPCGETVEDWFARYQAQLLDYL